MVQGRKSSINVENDPVTFWIFMTTLVTVVTKVFKGRQRKPIENEKNNSPPPQTL